MFWKQDTPIAGRYLGNLEIRHVFWNGRMQEVAELVIPHPVLEV